MPMSSRENEGKDLVFRSVTDRGIQHRKSQVLKYKTMYNIVLKREDIAKI